jgi:hypothetical protein
MPFILEGCKQEQEPLQEVLTTFLFLLFSEPLHSVNKTNYPPYNNNYTSYRFLRFQLAPINLTITNYASTGKLDPGLQNHVVVLLPRKRIAVLLFEWSCSLQVTK